MELSKTESLRLIAIPHMLAPSKDRIDVIRPVGGSVGDHMRSIGWQPKGLPARVFLDGVLVGDAAWESMVPRDGQSLSMIIVPRGGDNGKSALRITAMIGIVAASVFTAGAGAPLAAAFGFGTAAGWGSGRLRNDLPCGGLAVHTLIPMPSPQSRALIGGGTHG